MLFKKLSIALALASFAVPVHAVNWGSWGNNTNLRSPQLVQAMQTLAAQSNMQLVNAGLNGTQAGTPAAGGANAPVQLGNTGTLVNVTSGQMLNPATGLPTGTIGSAVIGGAGGVGAGVAVVVAAAPMPATITLPNDMTLPGFEGVSAAEIASGRLTMICFGGVFCSVKNPASTFVNSGSDVATQQAWGIWQGTQNATFSVYMKQTQGSSTITLQNVQPGGTINQQAVGPMFTGVLPATGTFNYTYLGGVISNPTTNTVGTVNSATLTANFTAATVQNTLNATIAGTTYTVNTPALPIQANGASSFVAVNGGLPTSVATCTPVCTANVSTNFNGAAGAGAIVMTVITPAGPGTIFANTIFKR